MPEEIGVSAPSSEGGANQAAGSPPVQDGSGAPSGQSVAGVPSPVQGTEQSDPLAGLPPIEELQKLVEQNVPHAKALAQLRGAYEPLKQQFDDISGKYKTFEPFADRFENSDQLKNILELQDSLIGWENQNGVPVPSTLAGAEKLNQDYPQHADFLAADLLQMETVDPGTGRRISRIDLALEGIAKDNSERAKAAKILGLVEPSSISPQWQPTAEELAVVRPELQDVYKKLPYEERQELKLAAPDYINRVLEREKFTQELQAEREQSQKREQEQVQRREQYIQQQANQAGDQYVQSQLTDALTTFHNSVVEQCNFISPLDPANLPQGITAEQATQMNQQILQSNQAEAAQITLSVIGLINPETRPFVQPLLQQIGVIDEKLIKELDQAAGGFGDNGRNYGILNYRGRLQTNGNGYQPDASVTRLGNEAGRNLKLMAHIANQVKTRLMEKRSQFFQLKATDHNQTLNSVAPSRSIAQGSAYDPTTANAPRPQGWLTRQEIERQYS